MTRDSIRQQLVEWLRQGMTPRRLAVTLALGLAVGCIPVVGITTLLCAALALAFGLNQPAIQAANYAVMPAQIVLIVPFVRLGGWLFRAHGQQPITTTQLLHTSPLHMAGGIGVMAAEALVAWIVVAVPVVMLLTFAFTLLLRRIPAIAAAEAAR